MSQRHTLLHPNETATVHSTNSTANDWTILKPKCALQCHLFLNIWNTTTKLSDIFVSNLSHGVNNKEQQCCLESVAFHTWACARSHVLFDRSMCLAGASVLLRGSSRLPPSPLLPSLFSTVHTVWRVPALPSVWGLMAGLPGFASHGSSLHLGAGCQ